MEKKIVHYNGNYKLITIDDVSLDKYIKICNKIDTLKRQKEELECLLKDDIHNAMNKLEKKKYTFSSKNYELIASITSAYNKNTFMTDSFKKEHLDLYNEYLKTSYVDERLSLEVKKI